MMNFLGRSALGLAIALLGALLAIGLKIPLPWMLGPLLLTAATRICAVPSHCAPMFNRFGRWMIGLSLGMYFTPQVAYSLASYWPLMLLGMAYAMGLACVGAWAYQRYSGLDKASAWFAAAIGSSSEMADMAQRYGARVDQVATTHSVRVLLMVVIVPFAFQYVLGAQSPSVSDSVAIQWPGLLSLIAGSWGCGWLFNKLRIPNAWVLGPMSFAMVLTLNELYLSSIPPWLSWAAQLCIGWSLGDKYRADFLRSAPRLLGTSAGLALAGMLGSVFIGWALSLWVEIPVAALILALVPGGIAEMAITAKVLGLAVPFVTALQVSRMLCVVLSTGWLYQRFVRPRSI